MILIIQVGLCNATFSFGGSFIRILGICWIYISFIEAAGVVTFIIIF